MKAIRKLLIASMGLVLFMGIFAPTALAASQIGVTINGTAVEFEDQMPAIVDGRTLVPVSDVFRALGFSTSWDGQARETTLVNNDHHIVIAIDSDTFYVNGTPQTLDVPAQIINDRNMLPIRAVLEAVGKDVDWDGAVQTVVITYEEAVYPDVAAAADIAHAEQREVPIWYYYAQYRNSNPRAAASNGHFAATYENFITTQARPNTDASFSYLWDTWPFPPIDPELDQAARNAMQEGFAGDEVHHTFPFTPDFFDSVTDGLEYHFFLWDSGEPWGFYRRNTGIVVGIGMASQMTDAPHSHTVAHEIAHSLGLGEHLAFLFEEVLSDWRPTSSQPTVFGWSLRNSSAMDRVLMDLAGPAQFWEAVFWSQDSYIELWNQYLGHFVPYETMQLARAGHQAVRSDVSLAQSFMDSTGQEDDWDLTHISVAFANAFDTNLPQARRDNYARIARQEITDIAIWAQQQGLQPYQSHYADMPTRIMLVPIN